MTRHPIGVVAERTGLSQEVLRVWERRYGVVEPERGDGGQRLYSDADVERLLLLRRATQGGRSISSVARRPLAELERLVREDDEAGARRSAGDGVVVLQTEVEAALAYTRTLNAGALDGLLRRVVGGRGIVHFVDGLVAPFMRRVGDEWHAGRLTPAHEHMATSAVQRVVAGALAALPPEERAPAIVVASLSGDRHEVGVLLAAAAAAAEGWRVVYLGADLPAVDILAAARGTSAEAVGLSVVYAESAERSAAELRVVREGLSASIPVLVGGAAARGVVEHGGVEGVVVTSLDGIRSALRRLRPQAVVGTESGGAG